MSEGGFYDVLRPYIERIPMAVQDKAAGSGLRTLSAAQRELEREHETHFDLNEIRFVCIYEGIPVYCGGRSRARYVDEKGFDKLRGCMKRLKDGRWDYLRGEIHPVFAGGQGDEHGDRAADHGE